MVTVGPAPVKPQIMLRPVLLLALIAWRYRRHHLLPRAEEASHAAPMADRKALSQDMARAYGRNRLVVLLAAVVLLIALPTFAAESREAPAPPAAPPGLDAFLMEVRRDTPPAAQLLVIGNPPDLVFQRSTYWLYPRALSSLPVSEWMRALRVHPLGWSALRSMARRRGARYVLLWGFAVDPHVKARVHLAGGRLVEVST